MFGLLSADKYDVLVNVTDICDARCVMCNIWKNQERPDSWLQPDDLKSVDNLCSISFAGGEPFMHEGIVDLVRVVHERNPRTKIVFSTNGFNTDLIVEKVREILKIHSNTQVTISLDGMGVVHDKMRGIPGAWDLVNDIHDRLLEVGVKRVNFNFTVTEHNYTQIPEVFAHARSKGSRLGIGVAQSSAFLNVELKPIEHDKLYPYLRPVIEAYLKSASPHDWARAFFLYGILRYLKTGRRPILCDALDRQYIINQTGKVYTCHPLFWEVGSLKDSSIRQILASGKADEYRPELRACHACWETCTARSGMRARIGRLVLWILWNKPLAHLGMWDGRKSSKLFPLTKDAKE